MIETTTYLTPAIQTQQCCDTSVMMLLWPQQALRLPVDIRILGSPRHVYKDCVLPLEKTALTSSFSVFLTHFVSHRHLVHLHCLVHCPRLCSFSSMLCIVWCPIGTPSPSSFLKRLKDLTLNLDFTELIHSISSRHTGDTPYHIM